MPEGESFSTSDGTNHSPGPGRAWRVLRSQLWEVVPYIAHLPVVLWLFAGALFDGQVFFFRDIAVYYYPNYVFLERWLRQGVWPLWNPTSDAGAPFLAAYPLDLGLVALVGATDALRLGPPLHLALAMIGASRLASTIGFGPWGIFAGGLFYGLSGYLLSALNLFELFQASAWAPWVIASALRLWASPGRRTAGRLALLSALQLSTLSAETVVQTAVFTLALLKGRPSSRRLLAGATAVVLALLLAAPTLVGVQVLIEGTPRAGGLTHHESYAWSLRPAVLLDAVLPHFFGDVHTFSDRGYWGQPFFPSGFPYLLSLYCGPLMLWLALRSGRFPGRWPLVVLCGFGMLLALGSHGPLEWLIEPFMRHFRSPPKFLFMSTLAVCLLAAAGFERIVCAPDRPSLLTLVPGIVLIALYPVLAGSPDLPGRILGWGLPELLDPRARLVIATDWPAQFATTGFLFVGAVLAARRKTLAPVAGLFVACDLLLANGSINLTADPEFYRLRPEVAKLIDGTRGGEPHRWFAYGAGSVPDLRWAPETALRNQDLLLYYMARQSLVPRTHVLDGLEGALDEDRVGWAPRGSTIPSPQRISPLYRTHHPQLRLANVRYVLSFRPLPEDLVSLRAEAKIPQVLEPLRLYELRDFVPRVAWVAKGETVSDPGERARRLFATDFDPRATVILESDPPSMPASPATQSPPEAKVTLARVDPHTVVLRANAGPGYVVVNEGYHRDWRLEVNGRSRPLLKANGRYWAIPTAGGSETFTVRYWPRHMSGALVACGIALLVTLALVSKPHPRPAPAG